MEKEEENLYVKRVKQNILEIKEYMKIVEDRLKFGNIDEEGKLEIERDLENCRRAIKIAENDILKFSKPTKPYKLKIE